MSGCADGWCLTLVGWIKLSSNLICSAFLVVVSGCCSVTLGRLAMYACFAFFVLFVPVFFFSIFPLSVLLVGFRTRFVFGSWVEASLWK